MMHPSGISRSTIFEGPPCRPVMVLPNFVLNGKQNGSSSYSFHQSVPIITVKKTQRHFQIIPLPETCMHESRPYSTIAAGISDDRNTVYDGQPQSLWRQLWCNETHFDSLMSACFVLPQYSCYSWSRSHDWRNWISVHWRGVLTRSEQTRQELYMHTYILIHNTGGQLNLLFLRHQDHG